MKIAIERATTTDAPEMLRVQIAAFHYDAQLYPGVEEGGPPGYDSLDALLERIADDDCYCITADGACVGGMIVFGKGAGHYHLDVIFIDPAYQNRGIGSQALHFLEATYAANRWTLDTPGWAVRNQHFYEKFGYVRVAEHVEADGTPLIAYEKRIART